jgi:hypothetical protein
MSYYKIITYDDLCRAKVFLDNTIKNHLKEFLEQYNLPNNKLDLYIS